MNIELDGVVVLDVSDDALELAAGGAQGAYNTTTPSAGGGERLLVLAIANRQPTPLGY